MARGWESKSVEMQIEERSERPIPAGNSTADAGARRELELLELSRRRLLTELEAIGDTGNYRLLALKRKALAHIEASIEAKRR
jgi:hypothetical protein